MSNYGISDYVTPVAGKMRITSGQGKRAAKVTTNGKTTSTFHHGLDIAGAKPGDKPPIRNVTAGEVVFAGNAGGWGKTVIVKNPDGYIVQYGHLDSIGVKVGDKLTAGQELGVMGDTGNVTGVHLDMIVVKDGKTITPSGGVLAAAPASILRRSKSNHAPMVQAPAPINTTQNLLAAPAANVEPEQPKIPVLAGAVGVSVPRNSTEAGIFSGIADMGLDVNLEQVYAEAGRAISDAHNGVASQDMLQSMNTKNGESLLLEKLGEVFDRL